MVMLFDIAVTSFLYWNFTEYGKTYIEFFELVNRKLDLSNQHNQAFLLTWLNKWGCRFDKKNFDEISGQITVWNTRFEKELPARGKNLWNLTQEELNVISEAYENLQTRTAYIRIRNGKHQDRLIGPTAASKIVFALRPKAAVAWDEAIRKGLRNRPLQVTYNDFLKRVKGDLTALSSECAKNGFRLTSLPGKLNREHTTPAQLVGEYYWATLTKGLEIPDPADFKLWISWANP